jgi:hypothetical protein
VDSKTERVLKAKKFFNWERHFMSKAFGVWLSRLADCGI